MVRRRSEERNTRLPEIGLAREFHWIEHDLAESAGGGHLLDVRGGLEHGVIAAAENTSMAKKFRDVTKALHRAGWHKERTRGSHEVWRHMDGREVTIPAGGKSNREVPAGTLAAIRRATGLEELR